MQTWQAEGSLWRYRQLHLPFGHDKPSTGWLRRLRGWVRRGYSNHARGNSHSDYCYRATRPPSIKSFLCVSLLSCWKIFWSHPNFHLQLYPPCQGSGFKLPAQTVSNWHRSKIKLRLTQLTRKSGYPKEGRVRQTQPWCLVWKHPQGGK